jgi:hypothetical protein
MDISLDSPHRAEYGFRNLCYLGAYPEDGLHIVMRRSDVICAQVSAALEFLV